jgi:hypothetical protein
MDQRQMDVVALHVRASELDTAAKYAIYALVTLIAALRDVIDSPESVTQPVCSDDVVA